MKMGAILEERGVNTTKMQAKDMRDLLKTFPDLDKKLYWKITLKDMGMYACFSRSFIVNIMQ